MKSFANLFRNMQNFGQKHTNYTQVIGFGTLIVMNKLYMQSRLEMTDKSEVDQKYATRYMHSLPPSDQFFNSTILISGNANKELSEEISQILGLKLANCRVSKFADGQVDISINESVRGKDVFVIQPTCFPVNDNLMELLLLVSTLRRSSARKITVVVPYYGYSRQDRKTQPRVPISAADVARLLETVGVDRMINIDLHCGQIQGFFGPRVPVDNLEANEVGLNYLKEEKELDFKDLVIVSPDAGGVIRAKKFQELVNQEKRGNAGLAMIIKQREGPGKIAQMNLVGDVQNKHCLIVDDMIDTAGTLSEAAKSLKQHGAQKVYAFATHGLFSGNALNNISKSVLQKVIVTNSVPNKPDEKSVDKIIRLSVAPLLAQTIYRIQKKQSIADLFNIKKD